MVVFCENDTELRCIKLAVDFLLSEETLFAVLKHAVVLHVLLNSDWWSLETE